MNSSNLIRFAASAAAIAMLSACATPQAPAGFSPASAGLKVPASGSSGDLVYATGYSDSGGAQTFMLTYPQGKLIGSISQGAQGMCSDTNGNVYLLYLNSVIEYAHGSTTPIKTLRIPGSDTENCAVDPSTGNLAVTFDCPPCDYQNLAIFPNGSGTPTRYSAPNAYFCTYDNQGNLFLGGDSGSEITEMVGSSFINITLDKDIQRPGRLQWDGSYVTLQELQPPGAIYRIQVSGSTGTIVGETKFSRYKRLIGYSWISVPDGSVLLPFSTHGSGTHTLGIWGYPKAGHTINTINKIGTGDHGFYSVTVSVAPTR